MSHDLCCMLSSSLLRTFITNPYLPQINRDDQEVADLLLDVKEGYASVGFKTPSIIQVSSVAQASALPPPYYIVGTVPDFEPKTPTEVLAKKMLATFLQSPEKGVLLDMCYKPRVTRHIKLARENGWKDVDGVNIIAYQIETQWTLWAGEDEAKQIPIKEAREALYRAATG
jgi:quinate dehydrogenase